MKKKLLLVIAVVAMLVIGQQAKAQMKLGGGLVVGTKLSIDDDGSKSAAFGLAVKGLYEINSSFSIAPGFTYFFPSSPDWLDLTEYILDVDAHYNFMQKENMKIYAIGGLNYSYIDASVDMGEHFSGSASDSEIGLNLGAGLRTGTDMQFFGEVKYNTAFENVIASVGVLFNL